MHFCVFAARTYGRFSRPKKIGLNWFMPAFVKRSVGSSCGTTGLDGTNVWPCFFTKKSMNCWRISFAENMQTSHRPLLTVADHKRKILSQALGNPIGMCIHVHSLGLVCITG